jgi:hyperpolarization activated cyclic nucleotide-gated potassium channel 1
MVYFLTQGRVNFLAGGQELCFKTFVAGSYFGELEIFRKCMRLFHVRCETKVDMMTIDREYFTLLLQRFPKVINFLFNFGTYNYKNFLLGWAEKK